MVLVVAVHLDAGGNVEPLRDVVLRLGARHEAVLVVVVHLPVRDPVGILQVVFLSAIRPELGLEVAFGVVAFEDADSVEISVGRHQVDGDDRVVVFALGDHVLLFDLGIAEAQVEGQPVVEELGGVAQGEVVFVQIVVVDDAPGIVRGDGGIDLVLVISGRQADGVGLADAGLEEVAGVVGCLSADGSAPALVGAFLGGTVGALEGRHDVGAGELGRVAVVQGDAAFSAFLGGDDHDAVRGGGAVEGCGGRAGEDGDALDVVRVDLAQRVTGLAGTCVDAFRLVGLQVSHRDTVDDIEGVVVVGQGLGTAHDDTAGTAHARGGLADLHAGHLAAQRVDERPGRSDVREFHLLDVVGQGFFCLGDTHGGYDRGFEGHVRGFQYGVDDRTAANLLDQVFLADVREPECLCRGRNRQLIMSVEVGDDADGGVSFHGDAGADERFARLIGHRSGNAPGLGKTGTCSEEETQHGREGACEAFLELLVKHKVNLKENNTLLV